MKTLKMVLIGIALNLFFTNVALADDYYNPVIKIENKKIYLSLDDVSEQTSVRILDYKGEALIEENIAISEHFESVLNLEFFPHGTYKLVIHSTAQETVKSIMVNKLGVNFEITQPELEEVPALSSPKRGRLHLSFANPSSNSVNMVIFDTRGQRRYQESFTGEKIIDKDFNLKQLPTGKYTVVLNAKNGVHTKQIWLR